MSWIEKMMKWLSKLHFAATLVMFFFIALMVVEEDINVRTLLLLPVVLSYLISKLLYAMEQKASTEKILEHYKKR